MKYVIYADTDRAQIKRVICAHIDSLDEKKHHQIVIDKFSNSRSTNQNAALFGLAYVLLTDHTGITKDDLHEYYCMKHFGTVCRFVFGRKKYTAFRTTTQDENGNNSLLSTIEFKAFFEFVQCEAAKLGCNIPNPQKF
jgi:hypothetical protein